MVTPSVTLGGLLGIMPGFSELEPWALNRKMVLLKNIFAANLNGRLVRKILKYIFL